MHSTTWTLLGAGLVFLTFVVKEIFSEHLKDLGGALNNAESVYTLHQDSDLLWAKLMEMEAQLAALEDKLDPAGPVSGKTVTNRLQNAIKMVGDLMSNSKIWFDQVSRLLERLPSRHKSLRIARDQLATEIKKVEDAVKAAKAASGSTTPGKDSPNQAAGISDKVGEVLELVNVTILQVKIAVFTDQVLETVRTAQKRADSQYKWCARTSYLLYAIGWALALIAQLHGGGDILKVG
ncbi:MAG: hypothetical protein ABSH01_12825 [Terriglobia bacterium]|jgi:hypothetical protein